MTAEPLSQAARSLGILQAGAAILAQAAAPFDLPAQAAAAARILDRLTTTLDRFATVHNFRSGLGLSAPQLGIPRAAVVIRAAHGERHALLNPRIIDQSANTDEEYEGCLSFFDVRGLVIRPLTLHVEHQHLMTPRDRLGHMQTILLRNTDARHLRLKVHRAGWTK